MTGGFTFCGHDIADLGLEYVPENENTYVYAPTEAEVHSETFDGHHGGYFYGATKKPKEFILRCMFEERQVDRGLMTQIYALFKVGNSGKLIFKRRPWCYYYATVTSNPKYELTNYLNGLVTITMQASYPFARGESTSVSEETEEDKIVHAFYNLPSDLCHDDVMLNTGLLESKNMVPPLTHNNVRAKKSILLCNPGTERAHVGIIARGNAGGGVKIYNNTTKQKCRIVAMTKALTTNVNKDVVIDGISGKTMLKGAGENQLAFLYHDEGFIELEPNYPVIRNVFASYIINENTVRLVNILYEDVVGKYIYLNRKWRKIVAQEGQTLTIRGEDQFEKTDSERTIISSMNEIEIEPVTTMDVTKLTFSYKPTYA